jgi:hypothetical protein
MTAAKARLPHLTLDALRALHGSSFSSLTAPRRYPDIRPHNISYSPIFISSLFFMFSFLIFLSRENVA